MRRLLLAGTALLILLAAALWLLGRAPSRYVLEQECSRYQEERRERGGGLRLVQMQAEAREAGGVEARAARAAYDGFLRSHKRLFLRGWEVLLLPSGAPLPPPGEFRVALEFNPSGPHDRPELKGTMRVWIAPRAGLARLFG